MRNILIASLVLMVCFVIACNGSKTVTYNFPVAMQEPVLTEYVKMFDKGKILFDINCANCHNVKVGKRQIYPDFSSEELAGYNIRILNPKHEDKLTEQTITEEELAIIKVFLAYKKKNSKKDNARLPKLSHSK